MLQASQYGGDKGLQDFLLLDPAEKSERCPTEVLIRMLEVVPQVLADKNLQEAHISQNVGHKDLLFGVFAPACDIEGCLAGLVIEGRI